MPGSLIPIYSKEKLNEENIENIIVFPWNIMEEISKALKNKNLYTLFLNLRNGKFARSYSYYWIPWFYWQSTLKGINADKIICWSHQSKNYFIDIYEEESWMNLLKFNPKRVILLSWPGLPNYNATFHVTKNLPQLIKLLKLLIINGLKKIVITEIL